MTSVGGEEDEFMAATAGSSSSQQQQPSNIQIDSSGGKIVIQQPSTSQQHLPITVVSSGGGGQQQHSTTAATATTATIVTQSGEPIQLMSTGAGGGIQFVQQSGHVGGHPQYLTASSTAGGLTGPITITTAPGPGQAGGGGGGGCGGGGVVNLIHQHQEHQSPVTHLQQQQQQQLPPPSTQQQIKDFWPKMKQNVENLTTVQLRDAHRNQELPLARIKKIMKLDEDVKGQMISAEAPVLFARASEMFIEELTLRAWLHTEDNKRKTLQKNDIAMAISKYEQFDFLIDIVPREDPSKSRSSVGGGSNSVGNHNNTNNNMGATSAMVGPTTGTIMTLDGNMLATGAAQQVQIIGETNPQQYFIQMPPQSNQAPSQSLPPSLQLPNGQIVQATQIGNPIPLSAGPGQTIQLVTMDGQAPGPPIQLQMIAQPEHQLQQLQQQHQQQLELEPQQQEHEDQQQQQQQRR